MQLLAIFGVTLAAFLLVIAGMAVGVIMGRREISGSCGGLGSSTPQNGEAPSCSLCSDPDAACRELGRRMNSAHVAADPTAKIAQADCDKDCVDEGCSKEEIAACKGI